MRSGGDAGKELKATVADVARHRVLEGRRLQVSVGTGGGSPAGSPQLPCPHERPAVATPGSPGLPGMRSVVLRSVRWWAGPLLLAAVALAFDAAERRIPFGVWTTGPVDEVAHLCTAALGLLVLACFIDAPRRFYVAALIASVAIDLDHIPLYLGLLGNEGQRPFTHSLSTVAVFAAAAVASRRHRAVLAGVATGLVLHFARDIAEGYPGVRVFWPLQDTFWMVSYRWFLGMIVVFTAARLGLVSVGLPNTRIPIFPAPSPPGPNPHSPDRPTTPGDRHPGLEPQQPDLEAARKARSRTSLRSPPGAMVRGTAGSRSVGWPVLVPGHPSARRKHLGAAGRRPRGSVEVPIPGIDRFPVPVRSWQCHNRDAVDQQRAPPTDHFLADTGQPRGTGKLSEPDCGHRPAPVAMPARQADSGHKRLRRRERVKHVANQVTHWGAGMIDAQIRVVDESHAAGGIEDPPELLQVRANDIRFGVYQRIETEHEVS
jgi:membrane-bound metal-dependent hydrolase YbcI (DUF457 family)